MRIFMLGWEFPPFISGGLGTACYGLTKAMDSLAWKLPSFCQEWSKAGMHSCEVTKPGLLDIRCYIHVQ